MNKETQDAQSTSSDNSLKVNINKGSKHAQPAADTSHPASSKPATSDPATATRSQATLTRPQHISYTRAQADAPKKNSPASDQATSVAKPSAKPHQAPKASVFDYRSPRTYATSVKPIKSQTSSTQTSSTHTPNTKSSKKRHSSKKAFNKQTTTMIACVALAICLTILVTWGVISMLNRGEIKEETTFATNDNQTTITIEPSGDDNNSTSHTRTVYEYDGNNVVGMKTYFEYADNEAAKRAYELVKDQPEFKGAEVVDKYIVVTADPNSFKGLTADDVRQQAEAIERFQKSRKKSTSQPEQTENQEEHHEEQPEEHIDDASSPGESE